MNNKKEKTASTWIQLRCEPMQKSKIVRQLKDGESLTSFMLAAADEKVSRREVLGDEY